MFCYGYLYICAAKFWLNIFITRPASPHTFSSCHFQPSIRDIYERIEYRRRPTSFISLTLLHVHFIVNGCGDDGIRSLHFCLPFLIVITVVNLAVAIFMVAIFSFARDFLNRVYRQWHIRSDNATACISYFYDFCTWRDGYSNGVPPLIEYAYGTLE